jgi:hypothetical protein
MTSSRLGRKPLQTYGTSLQVRLGRICTYGGVLTARKEDGTIWRRRYTSYRATSGFGVGGQLGIEETSTKALRRSVSPRCFLSGLASSHIRGYGVLRSNPTVSWDLTLVVGLLVMLLHFLV